MCCRSNEEFKENMLHRERFAQEFNQDLLFEVFEKLSKPSKSKRQGKCFISTRTVGHGRPGKGSKPRIPVPYRQKPGGDVVKARVNIDVHIIAMMKKRHDSGLPLVWEKDLTVSHLCHNPACIEASHLHLEAMSVNNARNKCAMAKNCTCNQMPKCIF